MKIISVYGIDNLSNDDLAQGVQEETDSIGMAYMKRAFYYEKLGNSEAAQKDFETAREICSEKAWNQQYAWYYSKNNNPELAIEYYTKLIDLDSEKMSYYADRAAEFEKLERLSEAATDYKHALSLREGDIGFSEARCYNACTNIYIRLGKFDKALELCEEFEKNNRFANHRFDYQRNYIAVYEAMGEYSKALEYARDLDEEYEGWMEEGDYYDIFEDEDVDENRRKIEELEAKVG